MLNKLKKYFQRRSRAKRLPYYLKEEGVDKYKGHEDYFMQEVRKYENIARKSLKAGEINSAEGLLRRAREHLIGLSYDGVLYTEGGREVRRDKNVIERAKKNLNKVERDIKRLENLRRGKSKLFSGLESKTLVFIGSFLAGIALSLISIKPTGNAIGSLTGTAPGLFGIFLFVLGIAGLFFSGKK